MAVFLCELKKARRRHDLPVTALLGAVAVLWAANARMRSADALACGYSALYYGLPLINTVLLPTGISVLASRIWDVETKGAACKLLFTLQSRASLFAAKAALGLLELAAVCAVELGGALLMARRSQFTETPAPAQLAWLVLCTYAVGAMLFFFELLLSVRSASQYPVLALGVGGSFVGLFTAFMPPALGYLIPWSYFTLLSGTGMRWDPDAQLGQYYPLRLRWEVLALALALAAVFCLLGRRAVMQKEV